MKSFLLAAILICACGSNRNETMTRLLEEKKSVEESIHVAKGAQTMFDNKSAEVKSNKALSGAYIDSFAKYYGIELNLRDKLKAVNFSIDSLSRMK